MARPLQTLLPCPSASLPPLSLEIASPSKMVDRLVSYGIISEGIYDERCKRSGVTIVPEQQNYYREQGRHQRLRLFHLAVSV